MAETGAQSVQVDTPADFGEGGPGLVLRWMAEIDAYERTFKPWSTRVPKIIDRYRAEPTATDYARFGDETGPAERRFNIFWSNVQTLQPAIYSATPKPEVSRRYGDKDPVARLASEVLERALSTTIETGRYDETFVLSRDDYLLGARGQAWVRYVPTYGEETRDRVFLTLGEPAPVYDEAGMPMPPAGPTYLDDTGSPVDAANVLFGDAGEPYMEVGESYRPVVYEEVRAEHVQWDAFGHVPSPEWSRVPAVWRWELMTREQLVERFGPEIGAKVPLTHKVGGLDDDTAASHGEVFKRAKVYEVWDKPTRRVYWFCRDYKENALDILDDPLGLDGFFPCPKPLYGTMTPNTLVPVPDFVEYQSQAQEIDELTERISLLVSAVKVAGVYDASLGDKMEALVGDRAENIMIPVDNWAMFAENGGLPGSTSFMPLEQIVRAIQILSQQRSQIKQDLYEVTGISDLVRGQGQASETATAQRIKGNFATMRLQDRQKEMARFARDVIRLTAEVIAEHFSSETLAAMAGVEHMGEREVAMFPEAVKLLRDDRLRTFRVDIETDSTVQADRIEEQRSRTEFLSAVVPLIEKAATVSQQVPALAPIFGEMLLFGVRGYRAGRTLESKLEELVDGFGGEQGAAPSPANENAGEAQAKAMEAQAKAAVDQGKLQLDAARLELDRTKAANDAAAEQARLALDAAKLSNEQQAMMAGLMQAVMSADPAVVASLMAALGGRGAPVMAAE